MMQRNFKVTEQQLNDIILTACSTTLRTGLLPDADGLSQGMLTVLCEFGLLTELDRSEVHEESK